jgi:uncharacterized membrane protein
MRRNLTRYALMVLLGAIVAVLVGMTVSWLYAPSAGWAAACVSYTSWVWSTVWGMDAGKTRTHATREDPTRAVADLLVLGAAVASLAAVVIVLVHASQVAGAARPVLAAFALVSVALSWILVHTLYTLRYARLYYGPGGGGGVDFNQQDEPCYSDFAYLSFTLGMTFQVSDTNIRSTLIRRTVLRHSLLSYVFGSLILATTVNLVAGLA